MSVSTAVAATLAAVGIVAAAAGQTASPRPVSGLPPHYAESVAVYGMSPDGADEIRVRLARFPEAGTAALWLSLVVDGERYGLVDSSVALPADAAATPVDDPQAGFAVAADQPITVSTSERDSARMHGQVRVRALAHRTLHPPTGAGPVPVELSVDFRAGHRGVAVRPGRRETFGTVTARVTTPSGQHIVSGPGKWHEQIGPRPGFAPAFSYFWGAAGDTGLLARGGVGEPWGFLREGGAVTPVAGFTIDAPGAGPRHFRIRLVDGRTIAGSAETLRESSVPIEGDRRPSATVRIESDLGEMFGHLNDWRGSP